LPSEEGESCLPNAAGEGDCTSVGELLTGREVWQGKNLSGRGAAALDLSEKGAIGGGGGAREETLLDFTSTKEERGIVGALQVGTGRNRRKGSTRQILLPRGRSAPWELLC